MKTRACLLAFIAVGGCSTTTQTPREIEAVRDFVVAAELEEVTEIRLSRQMTYTHLNVRFVTIPTRRGDYLVEFHRDCRELNRVDITPEMVDIRHNQHVLSAKFDTIRGCRIDRIYEISEAQSEELKVLGDAPGDEFFLPDQK